MPELILGCGSVIIPLFLQYWPKISSSLLSYFLTVPRFGAFLVILCVFWSFYFCISAPLFYSIRLIPLISANLSFWRKLMTIGWFWIGHFYFRFYQNGCLICQIRCRNLIMCMCKHAHRNLKLQTKTQLYLVWPTAKKDWVHHDIPRPRMAWQGNYYFWGILIKLFSTNHGHIRTRYVPFR